MAAGQKETGARASTGFPNLWQDLVARSPRVAVSCDIDASCQRVLFQHTSPPEFIVPDLCAFVDQSLLPELNKKIDNARVRVQKAAEAEAAAKAAAKRGKTKGRAAKKARATKQQGRNSKGPEDSDSDVELAELLASEEGDCGYAEENGEPEGDRLLRELLELLTPDRFRDQVKCLNGKVLNIKELANEEKLFVIAGSVCKDWSTMNKSRQQLTGQFILPFALMLGLIRVPNPILFLHECTRLFRPKILSRHLPSYSLMHTTMEPTDLGFPVRRGRSYSALVGPGYKMVHNEGQLMKLFSPLRLDCGVFWAADNDEAWPALCFPAA